jgi:hypothetical protein
MQMTKSTARIKTTRPTDRSPSRKQIDRTISSFSLFITTTSPPQHHLSAYINTMKLTIHRYDAVASWRWIVGNEEDVCGICQNPFEDTCPSDACRYPGEDCPVGMFCATCCLKRGNHCGRLEEETRETKGFEGRDKDEEEQGQRHKDVVSGVCGTPLLEMKSTARHFNARADTPKVAGECKHIFHKHCVESWLQESTREGRCPMCRQRMSPLYT